MDYKEFIEMVKQDLPQKLSGILEGANISDAKVDKIQGNSYEGISITPAGSFMGVTMDLQSYFEMYNDGLSKEYVLERIADTANSGYEQRPVLTKNMLLDYETMKHRLVLQVVGRENKEEMLKNIPHYDLADLAVIYRLKFGQDDLGLATVTVTNGLLKEYGITSEQLHQDALKQALFDEPCFLKNMSEEKKGEPDKVTLTGDMLRKYFPKSYTPQKMQETIIKLLEQWQRRRQQQHER